MKKPQLLAPAGNLRNLGYAISYGADAVYAGIPRYSLRVRNNDFHQFDNLRKAVAITHAAGRKFFLATNLLPHNNKIKHFINNLEPVVDLQPDALIMADPGLIMLVREKWPQLNIHLSVQANTMNYAAVRFWQSIGLKRIILSRELSLLEVREIRQQCPDMELEVFVHGALCIAYSGRCLLSGYFTHRDANQGSCTNSCRWSYDLKAQRDEPHEPERPDADLGSPGHPLARQNYVLEESERPGEFMPVEEDEHGTYIMNSKDLRAIEHIRELVDIGVDCVKIEGRTKSNYYVARVTQAYRHALDDICEGSELDRRWLDSLDSLSNRGYTDGFYQRHANNELQNYHQGHSISTRQRYVGEFTGRINEDGWAEVDAKNRFAIGDEMEIIHPRGNRKLVLERIINRGGDAVEVVPGGGHRVFIDAGPGLFEMGLLARKTYPAELDR